MRTSNTVRLKLRSNPSKASLLMPQPKDILTFYRYRAGLIGHSRVAYYERRDFTPTGVDPLFFFSQPEPEVVLKSMHTVWQLLRCMDKWKMRVEQVVPCCRALHATHLRITDKTRTLQASWEKYSHSKWSRVSLIQPNRAVPFNS